MQHHDNDVTTDFYFMVTWSWSKFCLSLHAKNACGFFFGEIPVRDYSGKKKMKEGKKYSLILQLAGGLSIQRFSVVLAVISEPTLMRACHCQRLFVRMLWGTGVEASNVLSAGHIVRPTNQTTGNLAALQRIMIMLFSVSSLGFTSGVHDSNRLCEVFQVCMIATTFFTYVTPV